MAKDEWRACKGFPLSRFVSIFTVGEYSPPPGRVFRGAFAETSADKKNPDF
jgi:hypothetical protein